MEDRKNRRAAFLYGLITFVVSVVVLSLLLTLHFLLKWEDDIFGKQLPAGLTSRMIFLGWASTIPLVLPVAGMAGSLMGLRSWSRRGDRKLMRSLFGGFVVSILFAALSFSWVSFGAPRVNLEMLAQLFDIRQTLPGRPMEHTSRELFRGNQQTSNLTEIANYVDTICEENDQRRAHFIASVENYADDSLLTALLNEPEARELGLTAGDFGALKGEAAGYGAAGYSMVRSILGSYVNEKSSMESSIRRFEMEKQKMLWHPLYFMLLCVAGMLLGIVSRKIHAAFALAGLFFLVMPGIYFADSFFTLLTKNGFFSPVEGRLYFMLVLLVFTAILGIAARFAARKSRVNIP